MYLDENEDAVDNSKHYATVYLPGIVGYKMCIHGNVELQTHLNFIIMLICLCQEEF